ncbi:MAG TPA: hypothetical protein VNW23_05930 [Opitutaceae bacterium]|jgi:hypothetical protein|nr:hypothetical protein [Opitutaceae bacterium]
MAETKFTEKDWDDIRMAFHTSIMVDTSLTSLAQNLDTDEWPVESADETPAKYIDLRYDELAVAPGFSGFPERIDHLITILRDTMAFDNPFGEMVQQTEVAGEKNNQLLRNFAKVDIPESYPIGLTQLSAETLEFCQRENLATLGQFAVFAQGLSQTVIVSGDFRKLLNAVSHVDENALAELLPFRPGSTGLHLPEALALPVNATTPAMRYALLRNFGAQLSQQEAAEADTLSEEEVNAAATALRARAEQFFAWFADELAELKAQIAEGGSIERYLMVLNDPVAETLAGVLLQPHLGLNLATEEKAAETSGFLGSIARFFGKK